MKIVVKITLLKSFDGHDRPEKSMDQNQLTVVLCFVSPNLFIGGCSNMISQVFCFQTPILT